MADAPEDALDGFVTISAPTAKAAAPVEETAGPERRRSKRMPYSCTAYVAGHRGHSLPDDTAFWKVQCRTLSQRGASFYSTRRPPHELIVISLPTSGQSNIFMSARVAHCRPVPYNGGIAYLVGCEFLERLA